MILILFISEEEIKDTNMICEGNGVILIKNFTRTRLFVSFEYFCIRRSFKSFEKVELEITIIVLDKRGQADLNMLVDIIRAATWQ